jgi:DNA-binding winged helix-turn-helix (wHTH) protein/tetratricopeptide (TPR) repeat protein
MRGGGAFGLMNRRFSADDLLRMDASARIPRPVDLAHTAPFQIGNVKVFPSTREASRGDRTELLEPLVMQVLVALHSARGDILSRDDLIDICWGGRAVTDDALNRVITRLRALAREFGGFRIETVTKVGYRLVDIQRGGETKQPLNVDRRILLLGAGAAGLGFLALVSLRLAKPEAPSPEADILLQKGLATLQNNDIIEAPDPGTSLQAIAFLTEATDAAPQSATAWGALAVAYSVRKRAVPPAERPGLDARGRAAAEIALKLDPKEVRAIAALLLLEPIYRNWANAERTSRKAFEKGPRLPILPAIMSNILGNVGRWRDAARYTKAINRNELVIPGVSWRLLNDLWASGDLQAADKELEIAVKHWPQHARVWRARVNYLMYSGRPADVLRILREPADIPVELNQDYLTTVRMTAEALAGEAPVGAAVARNLEYLRSRPAAGLDAAQACVALGSPDAAFDIFQGYYFSEGDWRAVAPIGGDEDRITNPLFQPVMAPIWREARFDRLLERIGLNAYWRDTRTVPDFRRFA